MSARRLIILGCAWFFCSGAVQALTLAQIRTQIRRNMRDTASESSRQRYSDSLILDFINEAQREITNLTWLCEAATNYRLTAGTSWYDLPSDFLAPKLVEYVNPQNQRTELKERIYRNLIQTQADWTKTPAQATEYTILQTTDTALQISYIGLPSGTSTGTVTIRYYNMPADLSSDSDLPFDDKLHLVNYHYAIVYHATARLKLIEARTDEAGLYIQLFMSAAGIAQSRLGQSPNTFPSISGPSGATR